MLFEAPHRLPEMLADAAAVLGDRPAVVARELTKLFETVRRGTLGDLAAQFAADGPPKGEIVVLIGEATGGACTAAEADAALDGQLSRLRSPPTRSRTRRRSSRRNSTCRSGTFTPGRSRSPKAKGE